MSLRDEVAAALAEVNGENDAGSWMEDADAALAVVRRHIETLPTWHSTTGFRQGPMIGRDAVLALLDEDAP